MLDVFFCRTCFGHNCSVEEKEWRCFRGSEKNLLSEAVSARIGSAGKKFRELSGVLVGKQILSLKQRGKIYQCCVGPVLLYCCETWELIFVD